MTIAIARVVFEGVLLVALTWALVERRFYRRLYRIHENRTIEAREHVGDLSRECSQVRRSLDRRGRAVNALLKRWMTLSLADRGDRDQLERDTDAYLTEHPANDA